ncbi:MAG: flagellar assembly protein FliW [Candidatus Sumerlaeota bacterium]|nr:flagellar assembly protein FliW [Candidatus Sumerlaeota bacterium]
MKVATTRFGEMEVPDGLVIQVPEGILGFPSDRRYVVLEHDTEDTPFKWLQSVDSKQLAFIVIDPRLLIPDYRLEFDEETVAEFGAIVPEEFIPMVIVNVPKDRPIEMTANLKAPIIVHETKRIGRQIILRSQDYSLTHRIFPEAEGDQAGAGQAAAARSA